MSNLAPIILEDGSKVSQRELWDLTVEYVEFWLDEMNDIKIPRFELRNRGTRSGRWIPGLTGYYQNGMVFVNLDACQVPGRGYSWPCGKSDRTPVGVVAHEVGHHVSKDLLISHDEYKNFVRGERPVSSYRPNVEEDIAEAMRLFILNPDLLKKGWPKRYKYLRDVLRLKPPHKEKWNIVLRGAPTRMYQMAERAVRG